MRTLAFSTTLVLSILVVAACGEKAALDLLGTQCTESGSVILTTVAGDPSTGPGIASVFSPDGTLCTIIEDFYSTGTEFGTGSAFISPSTLLLSIDGVDRITSYDLSGQTASTNFTTHASLTATPLRQMARATSDGSIFVVEANTNTVEKFDSNGNRAGNPFIATTVGSCVLSTPYGITYIASSDYIGVISSPAAAGRLSIYDLNGNCISHNTSAPFSAGTPNSIAYHASSGKLIVTRSSDHAIYSVNVDGTGSTQIYLSSTIINTPRAVAVDSDGYIYVSSAGTDTVEKLSYSGSGTATRALSGPFAGPGVYTQNVNSLTVIP